MAITISSLTPAEPIVVTDGDTIAFSVSASDDGGASLIYEWQVSSDGGTNYSATGLISNTNSFFNFGPVDSGSNGLLVRVAITNGVDTIYSNEESVGTRSITVTAAPLILALVDGTNDDYPVSENIDVNQTFDFTVTSSLQNVDISTTTNVNNITIVWQESTDDGSTWSNITPGGDFTVTTTTELFATGSTNAYFRKSTLTVTNSDYSRNLNQYRSRISYTGAANTPVDTSPILLVVEPVISIFKQPGVDPLDTETFQCYKTGIANSGQLRVSVGAVSTAGQTLSYNWQLFVDAWVDADDGTNGGTNPGGALTNSWKLKSGTNHTSPVLELDRFIFYNAIGFRCQITGSVGEPPVTTNTYYVYPTDVITKPVLPASFENIEDKYGNIANRDIYPESEQKAEIIAELNIARNTGLNGDVQMTMQRQNPGETTWNDVLVGTEEPTDNYLIVYTQFPSNDVDNTELLYQTPPLRVDVDNGAKFRIKATSSAVWGSRIFQNIGLESYTSTHNAPIQFLQALDDTTGGGNQPTWLQDYVTAIQAIPANATATLTTVATGGHNAFETDATLQAAIRNAVGSTNPGGTITNQTYDIVPADGETYTVDGTSYPVMGSLYVPTGLAAASIDVVVVFHGTLPEGGTTTIADSASDMLDRFVDTSVTNINVRDKIVFSVAYPQDHISEARNLDISGTGVEQADFLMGDNLPYARAAVAWVQNSLDAYIAAQGESKTVNDVYLFGHSQGGKLVSKINTLDTVTGVIADAPGPIQFDQTCSAQPGGTSCSKVIDIYGAPSAGTDTNTSKELTEFYSNEATLNVYRTVYITNQPSDASAFPNEGAAFSVTATPSSGPDAAISYQWQYSTDNETFVDVNNGGVFSGATTSLLQISSVPANAVYLYYRCVLSIPQQLASVTTASAELTVKEDLFTSITNLNDQEVEENSVVSWTVVATSLSAAAVTYQWQKSTNFNVNNPGAATWNNISGETSATFSILSASLSDAAFYRCVVTSFGGIVQATNAAELTVVELTISILQNITTSLTVLEGVAGVGTFETEAIASNSGEITYQWEYLPPGGSWQVAGDGFNNSEDNTRFYTPDAFIRSQNGIKLRCKISAAGIPNPVYTNQCTITVNRRLTYVKSPNNLVVTIGTTLVIDINPTWTGGTPSFQWQEGGSDISGATTSSLIIPNIDSTYNGNVYRCKITLTDCNQYAYTQNNAVVVESVNATDYTKTVTISTVSAAQKPTYYSQQTEKSGASIGTVICIPKPDSYVNNPAATFDDRGAWGIGHHGKAFNSGDVSSAVTSGSIFNSNKPSWVSNPNYKAAKDLDSKNRFKGYIEMRGQELLASEFPELARMLGNTYGGNITGSYPTYNASDTFRVPLTYGKKLMGTGNVSGNSGSVSVIPEYAPNGASGGDKLLPGSMGGVYNYIKSAQLPPGSTGITGDPDGTADGSINAETFTIGTFATNGWESVEGFIQPKFQGTVTYTLPGPGDVFTANPVHAHSAIAVGAIDGYYAVNKNCRDNNECLNKCSFPGSFKPTTGGAGEILTGPYGLSESQSGQLHTHTASGLNGSFDMVKEGGMLISDTTARMSLQSKQLFDNATSFYLRNNEAIPVNAAYFRLRYMIKAY